MENKKACIIYSENDWEMDRYFDKNGRELFDGDTVLLYGERKVLYETNMGRLGTDATNPAWIASGRAEPCDYGIYPLEWRDMENIEAV